MRSEQSSDHPPLHTVTTLLSEVREIRNRIGKSLHAVDQLPEYFESTQPQEEIEATFHTTSIYARQFNRDAARLDIIKNQLRQRGYHWE